MSNEEKPRVGVYVCHCGGNISDVVDTKKVVAEIAKNENVALAKDYIFMCSDPGQNLILEDIQNEHLTHIIVASCSPRLHYLTFSKKIAEAGLNKYMYEHVNIREQVSWVHSHEHEAATEKAIHLINGAIDRLMFQKPLSPIEKKNTQNCIVVGGGIGGLTAALDVARAGIPVDLIEKSPFLGGRVPQTHTLYPTEEESKPMIEKLIKKVLNHKLINVYTNTEITSAKGAIGSYEIGIKTHSRGVVKESDKLEAAIAACPEEVPNEFNYELDKRKAIYKPYPMALPTLPAIDWNSCTKCGKCAEIAGDAIELKDDVKEKTLIGGVVIVATGFTPYVPYDGEFGWNEDPNVITLPQLVRMIDNGTIKSEKEGEFILNGRTIKSVAMIHCVGSRQIEGVHKIKEGAEINKNCSRYCCTATLQSAIELKEKFPKLQIYDFFREIRTYGERESYYKKASEKNVIFFRVPDEKLPQVTVNKGNNIKHTFNIIAEDQLTYGREVNVAADLIVLATGMVPRKDEVMVDSLTLPKSEGGFLQEAHVKLRPVESSVDGIMLAGSVQAPMDTSEASMASTAASAKAISILKKEILELSPYVAEVNPEKCEGTGACVAECEYNALTLVDAGISDKPKKIVQVEPSFCVGCGACVPVCPNRAIDLIGYKLDQIEAQIAGMIKEVEL